VRIASTELVIPEVTAKCYHIHGSDINQEQVSIEAVTFLGDVD
jgi:hypothetical protein